MNRARSAPIMALVSDKIMYSTWEKLALTKIRKAIVVVNIRLVFKFLAL